MGNRHLSRSIVLQSLFEWDFGVSDKKEDIAVILERNAEEFAPGIGEDKFVVDLAVNVLEKQPELDKVIEKAAPDWPIDKISIVDRNVLRIGLFELLFGDRAQVPAKVAINEAIELAKTFGGENSGRFVNGVLGAVYKQIGEPGKNDTSKKNAKIDISKLPVDRLIGAVVYAIENEEVFVALVHDVFGRWTLSKGHMLEGEKDDVATVRKVMEEIGVETKVGELLGENEYVASDPERGKIRKQVVYYLAEAPYEELTLGESGGLDDARWFRLADIVDLKMYNDILPIVTKAINILLGNLGTVDESDSDNIDEDGEASKDNNDKSEKKAEVEALNTKE